MKRPADAGRGLDGVAKKSPAYYNPASELLEEGAVSSPIRPYGDTTGDGMVQLSFTLPMPHSKVAEGAAAPAGQQDGHGPRAGRARQGDGAGLHLLRRLRPGPPPRRPLEGRGRRARLPAAHAQGGQRRDQAQPCAAGSSSSGGCIGTDAHTVGIDAILNIKGFAGEKGLEYYRELKVVNLGAQVSVPQLVERAREEKADAVLVSQVVTQRDAHLLNTREMSAAFRESYPAATGVRC